MAQESGHLRFRHFAGVAFAVEADKAADPVAITALRPDAVVPQAHDIAHLLEESFGLARRVRSSQAREHGLRYKERQRRKQADYKNDVLAKSRWFRSNSTTNPVWDEAYSSHSSGTSPLS